MKKDFSIRTQSEKTTQELALKIARMLSGGEVILLKGDLGGGKTTFVKGLARGLDIKDNITSPSFVIKKIYSARNNLNLEHLDLYRVNQEEIAGDPSLLENFGSDDNIAIVEWGEKIQDNLSHHLCIKFYYIDQNKRKLEFSAQGKKENTILERINKQYTINNI